MQPHLKSFLRASILLLSATLWAQEVYHEPDLLARLSYQRSMIAPEEGEDVRQVCLAVSREGGYRIVRFLDRGLTQRLKGKMEKEPLQQLKTLLDSADFRALPGDHGGLIREYAETFAAEIPIPGWQPVPGIDLPSAIQPARRLQWLNADGESPFPRPVSKVVDWLKHFQPTNGKDLEYVEYRDVCPTVGLRLLQPSEASNQKP
jgi:hypothetical protein